MTSRVVVVCVQGRRPGAVQALRAAVSAQAPPPDQVLDLQVVEVRIGGGAAVAPSAATAASAPSAPSAPAIPPLTTAPSVDAARPADASPRPAVHLPRPRDAPPAETVAVPARLSGDGTGTPSTAGVVDGSAEPGPGGSSVVHLAAGTRFGVAVAAGLAHLGGPPRDGYVWLLDDGALPAPDALRTLLACARLDPGAAVFGPKLRAVLPRPPASGSPPASGAPSPPLLLEAGVSVDRAGRRYTGVRPGEIDRGQRDGVRDVLTVACSGMLVRAGAWRLLDGFDPELDGAHDIDLGWRAARAGLRVVVVPTATMTVPADAPVPAGAPFPPEVTVPAQAEAAAEAAGPGSRSARGPRDRRGWVPADRAGALRVRLANTARPLLPGSAAAILVGALPRMLGLLARGHLRAAATELALPLAVLGQPRLLARMRRRAARTRAVSHHAIRSLFPARLRRRAEARVVAGSGAGRVGAHRRGCAVDDVSAAAPSGRRSTRAAVLLAVVLGVVGLVALRGMPADVLGAGLPLPAGAHDLWTAVWSGRVATAGAPLDPAGPPPPWTALLAAVASLLGGRPGAAGWLLLAAGPALAGLTAHRALARLGPRPAARFGLAAAYGVSPAMTGAVAAGRGDTVAALILLPAVLAATDSALRGHARPAGGRPRAIWILAVCLVGFVACAPSMAPLVWIALPTAALLTARRRLLDVAAALPATIIALIPALHAGGAGIRAEPAVSLARFPQAAVALVAGAGERPKAAVVGCLAGCLACWLLGRWSGGARTGRVGRVGWSLAALGLLAVLLTPRLAGDADQRVAGGEGWWVGPQYGLVLAGALIAAAGACRPVRGTRSDPGATGSAAAPRPGRLARIVALPATALVLAGAAALTAGHLLAGQGWHANPTAWNRDSATSADPATSADRATSANGAIHADGGVPAGRADSLDQVGDPGDAGGAIAGVSGTAAPWSGTGASAVARAVKAETRTAPAGSRLLVLYRSDRSGLIRYTLAAAGGPRFPAGQARPARRAATFLGDVVTDLAVGGDQAAGWLPLLGVTAVAVPAADAPADLVTRLDATPSLMRDRARPGVLLWRPVVPNQAGPAPPSRPAAATGPPAYVMDSDLQAGTAPRDPGPSGPSRRNDASPDSVSADAPADAAVARRPGSARGLTPPGTAIPLALTPLAIEPLPAAPTSARRLPPDGHVAALPGATRAPRRDLVLAVPAGTGWRAWLNGRPLRPFAAWGWATGFRLPAEGGTIRLHRDDGPGPELALGQAVALGALLLLGIPALLGVPAARRPRRPPLDTQAPPADGPSGREIGPQRRPAAGSAGGPAGGSGSVGEVP
ncbi:MULTISPECIES: glycosyltransferase [Frankia]|uniref:glycosyltransferase n=1 Tax=Frankia TaxID=1854 RepID=UPI001E3341F3|nr:MULTISPECIES: glycosyltransferase [Frankia]